MSNIKQNIIEMYKQEINPRNCRICEVEAKRIRKKGKVLCGPKTLFHIGKSFGQKKKRLRPVFVGKTDWYTIKQLEEENKPISNRGKIVYNCLDEGKAWYDDPENSAFWIYIKDIIQSLKLSLDDYAVSNLAKCNAYKTHSYKENTPILYYQNCIRIFEKEMQIIRPTHIIFFTNTEFDDLINGLRFWFNDSYWYYKDIKDMYHKERITYRDVLKQNKTACWWHRIFYSDGNQKRPELQFLRTRHPTGATWEFKEKIIQWLTENN